MDQITQNFRSVLTRLSDAAADAGRDRSAVRLVAVTKTHAAEQITPVLVEGHRIFGENRVQEAQAKWPALKTAYPDIQLHLIGPLQTNKVRDAVALFDVIETVDRPRLAQALAAEMKRQSRPLPCFVQVNTGREPQKAGSLPEEADGFIALCRDSHGLNIRGLMCIPPADQPPDPHFLMLRDIARRNGLAELSMGMSADYQEAIRCGATYVRVGTAIFGTR